VGNGHHERRHGQRNAALKAALGQQLVDKAAWIAVKRHQEMPSSEEGS
jgi:hypothetical protein